MTVRTRISRLLLKLARVIDPPQITGVFVVDSFGHCKRM